MRPNLVDYSSLHEEDSLTRDRSEPSADTTPVARISTTVQPSWRVSSGGAPSGDAYYNELTLNEWLESNGFEVFQEPLLNILQIYKLDQILFYNHTDIRDFINECAKDPTLNSKIPLSLRSQFKTQFVELIQDYTNYKKKQKTGALGSIEAFASLAPSSREKSTYDKFVHVKEQLNQYVTNSDNNFVYSKVGSKKSKNGKKGNDNNILLKQPLGEKIGLETEFEPKIREMSGILRSKLLALQGEFEALETECLGFWKENSNPFDTIDYSEQNRQYIKQLQGKMKDFMILDQFISEFDSKLNKILETCRNDLNQLIDPKYKSLKEHKSAGKELKPPDNDFFSSDNNTARSGSSSDAFAHIFDEKTDDNSHSSIITSNKSLPVFSESNIEANLNRKRPRSSTAANSMERKHKLDLIYNSKYISLTRQSGSNVNNKNESETHTDNASLNNYTCIFHSSGKRGSKCDGNRKQRMILFNYNKSIQRLFKIKIKQMNCQQNKNKNRKYSFNFGVILVKNFFYDEAKFQKYFETYDQNLSIFSLSNTEASQSALNQMSINKIDSKFLYIKCSCIANTYVCAMYNNDKKTTMYQDNQYDSKYCIALHDILSIDFDSEKKAIVFKKNNQVLGTLEIQNEDVNKLDAYYALSSIGCDCNKDGNIAFEVY